MPWPPRCGPLFRLSDYEQPRREVNVLVTGAGLVGCNVARILKERGHEPVLYDIAPRESYIQSVAGPVALERGDIRDLAALIDTLQRHKIDTVVHTAYLIGAALSDRPYAGVRTNVDGAMAVMEAARLSGAKRLLFASTQGVYNYDIANSPISEDLPFSEADHPYVASKVACERLLRSLAAAYNLEFAILRFAQIYGRGHYAAGDLAGPIMHEVLAEALAGRPVRIDPGILSNNDYVYAKDVAQGVVLACEKPLKNRVYNLGSGFLGTPADVADAIRKAVPGASAEILSQPVIGPFWVHEQYLDITRAREDLGYSPQFDLVRGVADFVDELKRYS